MKTVEFNKESIEVIGSYDTVIIGGGTAGSAAAISAARGGNKTIVIEKSIALGGAAVNALVTPVMETFVSHGEIFDEIDKRLMAKGITTHDGIMTYVYSTAELKAVVLEEMLLEAGGEILFDAALAGCLLDSGKITTVIVTTAQGLIAVEGKQFIDATGDAFLSRTAGVETIAGDENGNNQMTSLRFEMGGIDVEKYRDYCLSLHDEFSPLKSGFFWESAMVKNKGFKLEPLFRKGIEEGYLKPEDLVYYQCFSLPGETGCMTFNCPHLSSMVRNTSAMARSKAISEGREMIMRLTSFLKAMVPGFEESFLIRIASEIGVRESWRIKGKYVLNEDDYVARAKFEDGVAKGDWYIDVHSATKGLVHMEKYQKGEYYEIPYRCLTNEKVQNLITIGRCISTTFLVQASIRIQATVIEMGDTAGEICAKALRDGTELNEYKYSKKEY